MDRDELARRRGINLWLEGHAGLHSAEEASAFLSEVALALRYGATDALPMASMYRATQRLGIGRAVGVAWRQQ